MATSLKFSRCENGMLVKIVGRGTMQDSPALRDLVLNWLQICAGQTHVDLSECDFLDSTFLGCLIHLHKECNREAADRFMIIADTLKKRELFKASFYGQLLRFVEQSPDRLTEFEDVTAECLEPSEFGRHLLKCHQQLVEHGDSETAQYRRIVDRLASEVDEN